VAKPIVREELIGEIDRVMALTLHE
jgi:hypothetical protein